MVTGALPCQYQSKQRPLSKHTLNTGTRALVTVRGRSELHACSGDEKLDLTIRDGEKQTKAEGRI